MAPRGKVLGGSGSINAMMWARGTQHDYDSWAAAGNPGWDYESVLPLFRQIEDWEGGASAFHGAGGPIAIENIKDPHPLIAAFSDSCLAMGMPLLDDMNGQSPQGVGPMSVNFRENRRSSPTAYLKLPSISVKQNLTILTNTKALKLQLTGSHCTGVELLRNGEIMIIEAAREVVLSAGAIEYPIWALFIIKTGM
ncbi:GMC family oxidoreductase [Mucilaginibacter lappiensis]|uniref:GMC family oxidoreductase n=1 Tax=Mucilaginibacter lappiensis TaxID=354630 RepID=UPI0037CBBEF1